MSSARRMTSGRLGGGIAPQLLPGDRLGPAGAIARGAACLALAALVACGGSRQTTTVTEPDLPDNAEVSSVTGVRTDVEVSSVTPDPRCDAESVETGRFGATYPWGGYTHWDEDRTAFTCNRCPNGLSILQGSWTVIGRTDKGEGELDADLPDPGDWVETLRIDGNTYAIEMLDARSGEKWEYGGYYVCTQKPENGHDRVLWIPTRVVAAGPAGNQVSVGRAAVSDPPLASQDYMGVVLLYWFRDGALTGGESLSMEYCRFGTDIDGKLCRDRFADR